MNVSSIGSVMWIMWMLYNTCHFVTFPSLLPGVIGNAEYHHFVTFGKGVEDASDAEHHCEKGDVILAPSAWAYCNPSNFKFLLLEGTFVKVMDIISFPPGEARGRPERGKPARFKGQAQL